MATKAKIKKMLDLRKLLQDEGLRTKLLDARDEKEVGRLLNAAGKGKGYTFPADWLGDLFVDEVDALAAGLHRAGAAAPGEQQNGVRHHYAEDLSHRLVRRRPRRLLLSGRPHSHRSTEGSRGSASRSNW
jgi:hypothetical protein